MFEAALSIDGTMLETSELKTRLCHRLVIKMEFKNQSSLQTTPLRFNVA